MDNVRAAHDESNTEGSHLRTATTKKGNQSIRRQGSLSHKVYE